MNNLYRVLMVAMIYGGAVHASDVPQNDNLKKLAFNYLNSEFTRGLDYFNRNCNEYQTGSGINKSKYLDKVPYCKQLINMMDEINNTLVKEFHGYKRYDITLCDHTSALVQKYRKAS